MSNLTAFCNLKSSRRFNVPPTRLTKQSPYPFFTKDDLDMRRKAEILKYKGVDQNSKTNDLTKNQKWANLVKGSSGNMSQYANYYQTLNNRYTSTCPSDVTLPTLTTASDVPGPPMYLYNDPNVPLYNYLKYNDSFAINNISSNSLWNLYTINQLLYLQSQSAKITAMAKKDIYTTEVELGVIKIEDVNQDLTYTYNISTPIGIWLTGIYIGTGFNPNTLTYTRPAIPSFTIQIVSIQINVYYDGEIVTPISNADYINPNMFNEITVDMSKTNAQIFYTVQYAGMLNINNLTLLTNQNSIYDVKVELKYKIIDSDEKTYPLDTKGLYVKAGAFCNLTEENINYIANPLTNSVMLSGVPIGSLVTKTQVSDNSTYKTGSFSQFTPFLK
jgi:hypothetical protein